MNTGFQGNKSGLMQPDILRVRACFVVVKPVECLVWKVNEFVSDADKTPGAYCKGTAVISLSFDSGEALANWPLAKETDSSTPLDKQDKQHPVNSNSRFNLHSPKLYYRFWKQYCPMFCLLSKEVCLYGGADWPS